jgi:hypothetical protein
MGMRRSVGSQLQRWWPVPAVLLGSLVGQKLFFESRYDVSGHAGEHLTSATAAFPAFALVVIVLYVTSSARRQPLVLATCAAWLACTLFVLVGNVRVAAGAVLLSVIVPPWIVPGAGVIVVTVACCVAFQRRSRELERGRQWAGGAPPVCA